MAIDYFQVVRRDGAGAVPQLAELPDVNLRNETGESLLHVAIAYGNAAAFDELLRLGIQVNAQDAKGQTPLHFAATYGKKEIIEKLLERGADVSIVDLHGNTPMWTAVFNARGKYDVVEVFIRYGGARVAGMKNQYGRSPLDFAGQLGDSYLVRLLRASNAGK